MILLKFIPSAVFGAISACLSMQGQWNAATTFTRLVLLHTRAILGRMPSTKSFPAVNSCNIARKGGNILEQWVKELSSLGWTDEKIGNLCTSGTEDEF